MSQESLMNPDQVTHLIRTAMSAAGPIGGLLVAQHYATADQANVMAEGIAVAVGLLFPIVTGIWGLFVHRTSAKIAAVKAMPGVDILANVTTSEKIAAVEAMPGIKTIVASQSAPQEIVDIVNDESRPKVEGPPGPPPKMADVTPAQSATSQQIM